MRVKTLESSESLMMASTPRCLKRSIASLPLSTKEVPYMAQYLGMRCGAI